MSEVLIPWRTVSKRGGGMLKPSTLRRWVKMPGYLKVPLGGLPNEYRGLRIRVRPRSCLRHLPFFGGMRIFRHGAVMAFIAETWCDTMPDAASLVKWASPVGVDVDFMATGSIHDHHTVHIPAPRYAGEHKRCPVDKDVFLAHSGDVTINVLGANQMEKVGTFEVRDPTVPLAIAFIGIAGIGIGVAISFVLKLLCS